LLFALYMEKCRRAAAGDAALGRALAALALAWSALLLGAGARARLGADVAALVAFGLALAALAATRARAAPRRPRARAFGIAVVGLVAGYASLPACWTACLAWVLALGLPLGSPVEPGVGSLAGWTASVLLAPLFEETLYRERLLGGLAVRFGAAPAVALSSALFALPHAEPAAVAATFLVGLGLGALRRASGSLALCVGLHAGLNLAVLACGAPPQRAALDPLPAALAGAALLVPATRGLRRRADRAVGAAT
jgi:membrane protease YdiL (CAAX protease family)